MGATAAHADTGDNGGPRRATKTVAIHSKRPLIAKIARAPGAQGGASATLAQDPPGGGCYLNDMGGNIATSYLDGALATLEASWTAKVLCTTTAVGQSMAGIHIETSIWHNATPAAQGTPYACVNCNLGNSIGEWLCVGPTCAGVYWIAAVDTLTLPDGWEWVTQPTGCQTLGSPQVLQCAINTESVVIPPTG